MTMMTSTTYTAEIDRPRPDMYVYEIVHKAGLQVTWEMCGPTGPEKRMNHKYRSETTNMSQLPNTS